MVIAILIESDIKMPKKRFDELIDEVVSLMRFSNCNSLRLHFFCSFRDVIFILSCLIFQTFSDADADSDGKINKEEWHAYVSRNPSLLRNMTLSDLKYVVLILLLFAS